MPAAVTSLKRHAPFPGDEIVLVEPDCMWYDFTTRRLYTILQYLLAHFGNGFLSIDDRSRIDIDDIAHSPVKCRIGGKLYGGAHRITCWRAEAGGKQYQRCATRGLTGGGLHIIARCAHEAESWLGSGLGIIQYILHRRSAALLRRSRTLDRIGDQSILDVPG